MRLADSATVTDTDLATVNTARPQVLYVDNTEAACRLLEHRFIDRDFDFEALTDAAHALARLRAQRWDVVVVAFDHQRITPIEVLRAARDLHPESFRAQAKAEPEAGEILSALNDGGLSRFITKTWSAEDLEQAIIELVAKCRVRVERDHLASRCSDLEDELLRAMERLTSVSTDYHERILDGLLAVLGFRERGARWHSYRAASYASMLGRQLGLDTSDIRTLNRGALLHDLGKIGISDQILLKPSSLDEAEWDEMRWHPALGHGLLNDFEFLGEARTIVLQHHERWDGTGYPNRLTGEAIHFGARITAVADAFDAMTTPRPYRDALTFDKAWNEIERCAGTQFDPEVVDVFLGMGRETWAGAVSGQRAERPIEVV